MGSYGSLRFHNLSIYECKSYVPDEWGVLFQETDRRQETRPDEDGDPDDDPVVFTWYETDSTTFRQRLALLGATHRAMKLAFDAWLEKERADWARYAEDWDGELTVHATEMQLQLASLDFEGWKAHANKALLSRYNFTDPYEPKNAIERQFHGLDADYLDICGYGDLLSIRALLEACPRVQIVKLDVSNLVYSKYYEQSEEISTLARTSLLHSPSLAPTVVLGEGSTDLLILKRALEVMYPALLDNFSFFNHAEFSVDGGAAYLVKFLKAFAAARVMGRFVAIFDNDAAGVQALEQAKSLNLPSNFLITKLPDIELAKCYPTVGPSGPADLDVNGSAAGIELYLGKQALEHRGHLRPIRWTGYLQAAKTYQGEVEAKGDVLSTFLKIIDAVNTPEEAWTAFPELGQVWRVILDLVEKDAEEHYLWRIGN